METQQDNNNEQQTRPQVIQGITNQLATFFEQAANMVQLSAEEAINVGISIGGRIIAVSIAASFSYQLANIDVEKIVDDVIVSFKKHLIDSIKVLDGSKQNPPKVLRPDGRIAVPGLGMRRRGKRRTN